MIRHEIPTYCRDCGDDVNLYWELESEPSSEQLARMEQKAKIYKCRGCLYLML